MSPSERHDAVFRALASPVRRALLDHLRDEPLTTGRLCALFPEFDRCSVMQHLKVLQAADLIIAERRGRERWNYLNPLPIQEIHERWIGPHAERAVAVLATLKRSLEKADAPAAEVG